MSSIIMCPFSLSEMHVIVLGKLDMSKKRANTDKSHRLSFQASLRAGNGLMYSMSEKSYIDKNHSGNCQNSVL